MTMMIAPVVSKKMMATPQVVQTMMPLPVDPGHATAEKFGSIARCHRKAYQDPRCTQRPPRPNFQDIQFPRHSQIQLKYPRSPPEHLATQELCQSESSLDRPTNSTDLELAVIFSRTKIFLGL